MCRVNQSPAISVVRQLRCRSFNCDADCCLFVGTVVRHMHQRNTACPGRIHKQASSSHTQHAEHATCRARTQMGSGSGVRPGATTAQRPRPRRWPMCDNPGTHTHTAMHRLATQQADLAMRLQQHVLIASIRKESMADAIAGTASIPYKAAAKGGARIALQLACRLPGSLAELLAAPPCSPLIARIGLNASSLHQLPG